MDGSPDDTRDRRRRSSPNSPGRDRDRRQLTRSDDHHRSSRARDEDRRRSRRDSPRRHSSRSPTRRTDTHRDRDRHRRERREGSPSAADEERRRRRHRNHRHRDRRDHDDEERTSRRHRTPLSRSHSPQRTRSPPAQALQRSGPLPSQSEAFEVTQSGDGAAPEKQKPNFSNTGRLAAESNTVQVAGGETIVLKYHEPPEARKPPAKEAWRLYVFKGEDMLEMVELGERSCWLIGRERLVVDFSLDHPSCSKQHAALQFRHVEKRNEFGDRIGKVKPYLIDLESANGSSVNGDRVPAGRYVEIMDKDVLRFGLSSREYVLMLPPT